MRALERKVQALLLAPLQEPKTSLDRGRVDTVFQVDDKVLHWTAELIDAAEIGKIRPRLEGSHAFSCGSVGRSQYLHPGPSH